MSWIILHKKRIFDPPKKLDALKNTSDATTKWIQILIKIYAVKNFLTNTQMLYNLFVISCNDYDKDAIIASVDFETISSHCSHELMSQIFATTCDSCKEFASSISKELPALKSTFDTNMVYLEKYI